MKLLVYSHFFAPSIGGVETIVLSLARGLAEFRTAEGLAEFEIILVTETPGENFNDRLLPFPIFRRPGLGRLWQLIRSSDLIHVAGASLSPIVFGLLARKPVIVEHHGFQTICPTGQLFVEPAGIPCPGHFMAGRHRECLQCRPNRNWPASWRLWLLTFVRRFLCARIAVNIMPTEWLRGLLGLRNMIAIPHGVEISHFDMPPLKPSRPPLIVFQGRLVTTKGIRVLLEAAAVLRSGNRSFELVIIGDGPERAALQKLAEELQLASHVRFTGRLNPSELAPILAQAGIVVVPSLAGEVFGLVVAENMSRGLAVVASDLAAFAEILGDAGLTFRAGDARDLARQLGRLLDDSTLAPRLGSRARQRIIDAYPRSRMLEAHAALYRKCML